jgi:hypothetical protein
MTLNFCDHIPRADLDHHPARQRGNVRRADSFCALAPIDPTGDGGA